MYCTCMDWLYVLELLWIAFMGIVPPFISAAILGYLGYWWGKKQGKKEYEMAKDEIREYIKGEFLTDLSSAVQQQLNGILGPVARAGSAEGKALAAQYAQQNPGIASMLTSVAAKGAARWLGKQLGVPKDVVDTIGGGAPFMFPISKKQQDDLLKPVELPHP